MKRTKKLMKSKRHRRSITSRLAAVWERHVKSEFEAHSVEATMRTMTSDPYVHNIPGLTGGYGQDGVREFYGNLFLPGIPSDWEIVLISRTIGKDQLVDEMIIRFTHSIRMDWISAGG
jgi:carboxymethylenebutenolidase